MARYGRAGEGEKTRGPDEESRESGGVSECPSQKLTVAVSKGFCFWVDISLKDSSRRNARL